jgi:purine-binding chemotaxis protein CheW
MSAETPTNTRPALDWEAIHARLECLRREAEGCTGTTPEAARAILDARARALARVPAAATDPAAVLNVVIFAMGGEPHAIEARFVRRVIRLDSACLTPIPGTPPVLAGVINLEGEILAVFDLPQAPGLSRVAPSVRSRILVLGTDDDEMGLIADAAEEVRPLRIDAIHEPPASLGDLGRGILRGVTAEALIVIDGASLLRDPRLFIDQGEDGGV